MQKITILFLILMAFNSQAMLRKDSDGNPIGEPEKIDDIIEENRRKALEKKRLEEERLARIESNTKELMIKMENEAINALAHYKTLTSTSQKSLRIDSISKEKIEEKIDSLNSLYKDFDRSLYSSFSEVNNAKINLFGEDLEKTLKFSKINSLSKRHEDKIIQELFDLTK